MTKPSVLLTLLLILAALGTVSGIIQSQHYFDFQNGTAAFQSFCNVNQTFNCDLVTASPYAELISGFPLAGFATGSFVALLLIALIARNRFWRREAVRAAFLLSLNGLIFSGIYFFIMASVLKTFCLLCILTDILSISIFGIVLLLKPEGFKPHKPDLGKWKVILGTMGASVLVVVGALKLGMDTPVSASIINDSVKMILASPVVPIEQSGDEPPSIGPQDAPITIVEFSDFQCPYCKNGALILNSVLSRYPGKVRLLFKNFPLDSTCNRTIPQGGHNAACEAAKTVWCASRQGKFQPVYEALFDAQSSLAPGKTTAIALAQGVDATRLQSCMDSQELTTNLLRDIEDGIKMNVQSTPTFFINGRRIEGALPVPVWTKIIDQLLEKK